MTQLKRALVVGGSGFLGGRLLARLGAKGVGTYRTKPEAGGILFDAVRQRLKDISADLPGDLSHIVLPFGAVDVEACARDPAGTSSVNIVAMMQIITDAMDQGLVPIFTSTDYVFGGGKSYWREGDNAEPCTSYGAQKLAIEKWLGARTEPWLVVRLSKVVSDDVTTHSVIGQWINEIKAGKSFRCADDQYFSPAFVDDLADAIIQLAEIGATGLYNTAGDERLSRIEILRILVEEVTRVAPHIDPQISPCSIRDWPFLEKRPFDTSMSVDKLKSTINYKFKTMRALCSEAAEKHFLNQDA